MNAEPLRRTFTKEYLQQETRRYLTRLYGPLETGSDVDGWVEKLGLLYGFVDSQFTEPDAVAEAKLFEPKV
jgi:hypothetical protein